MRATGGGGAVATAAAAEHHQLTPLTLTPFEMVACGKVLRSTFCATANQRCADEHSRRARSHFANPWLCSEHNEKSIGKYYSS